MSKTEVLKVDPEFPDLKAIRKAARVIKKGGLAAFSTETVYGLGADWQDTRAVYRLYEVKNRPAEKKCTVAISKISQAVRLGCRIPGYGYRLMEKFWPGPLTLILQVKTEKVGFRIPDDEVALAVLREAAIPVALPSANLSGNPPPLTAEDVLKDLDGRIEVILDSGKTKLGIESTILDLTENPPRILREGAIKKDELDEVTRKSILFVCTGNSCRSIMAEGLLKKMLEVKQKSNIEVDSAGIAGLDGIPPTKETVRVMKEEGVDVTTYRGKSLTLDLISRADLILVMQELHKREILHRAPQAKDKVYLLREFTADGSPKTDDYNMEVPDPISQTIETYKKVAEMIRRNIEKLTEML